MRPSDLSRRTGRRQRGSSWLSPAREGTCEPVGGDAVGRLDGCHRKRVEDFEDIDILFRGSMKKARAGLGVSAFGMQVIDMARIQDAYPRARPCRLGRRGGLRRLEGPAILGRVAKSSWRRGRWRVCGPARAAQAADRPEGARILALGGTPGEPFEAPAFSVESQPG